MKARTRKLIFLTLAWFLFAYSTLIVLSTDTVRILATEDGFFESATAIFFLISTLSFLYVYKTDQSGNQLFIKKTNKNIFFLFLAVIFFFAVGEEISWGQRILGIDTPEAIKAVNRQNEINLHNLVIFQPHATGGEVENTRLITIGRLFMLFWLLFCVVTPLVNKYHHKAHQLFETVNIPIVPLWIGSLFIVNYATCKLLQILLSDELHRYLNEIVECNYALLFCVLGIWYVLNHRHRLAAT